MTNSCPICGHDLTPDPCPECNAELQLIGRVESLESDIATPSIYDAEFWEGAE